MLLATVFSLALFSDSVRSQTVPATMKKPFVRIRECNMLIYWQEPYTASIPFTSFTIWAKTQFTRSRYYPFAANINVGKSYLRFTVYDLVHKPFYLQRNSRVCFKIAAVNAVGTGELSEEVCNTQRMHADCFDPTAVKKALQKKRRQESCENMAPAQPVIRHRDNGIVTVAWDKMPGALLYSLLTKANGKWRRLAVTRSNFYNIRVNGN